GAGGSGRCRPIAAFVVSFGQVRSRLDSHERDEDQGKPQPIESRTGVDRYGGSDDGGEERCFKQDRLGRQPPFAHVHPAASPPHYQNESATVRRRTRWNTPILSSLRISSPQECS